MGSPAPRKSLIRTRGVASSRPSHPNNPIQSDWLEGFGENWRLDRCSIKPCATCRGTHSAIDAIRQLRAVHQFRPEQIAAIEVEMSRFQFDMCGGKAISSRAQAQMSLPYAIAAELQFGKVGVAEIEPAAWTSPRIAEWLSRISAHIDDRMADEDEPVITVGVYPLAIATP